MGRPHDAATRAHVLTILERERARDTPWRKLAQLVALPVSTIRDWWARAQAGELTACRPGPKGYELTGHDAQAIDDLLEILGVEVGVPALKEELPHIPRRVLARRLQKRRQQVREQGREELARLDWLRPGTVWSVDFTEAPGDVDGYGDQVLVTRDLASAGHPILVAAMRSDGLTVARCLERLFSAHGAPLVLKLDNGFKAQVIKEMAARWGVLLLFSPPARPGFNGSIETGMSPIRRVAHLISCANGRHGEWTGEDLEAARMEIAHRRTSRGIPADLWAARQSISACERKHFLEAHRQQLDTLLGTGGRENLLDLDHFRAAAMTRRSITAVLVAENLLEIEHISVPPRKKKNRTLRKEVSARLRAVKVVLGRPIDVVARAIVRLLDAQSRAACKGEDPGVEVMWNPSPEAGARDIENRRRDQKPRSEAET